MSPIKTLMVFEDKTRLDYRYMPNNIIEVLYSTSKNIITTIQLSLESFESLKSNFFNEERKINMNNCFYVLTKMIIDLDDNKIYNAKIQAEEYDNIFTLYYIHNGIKHYIFDQENYIKERIYN
jgi:hypothetical protein